MFSSPPRAAYIHVPFCVHRCGYCNFSVVADRNDLVESYLSALATELGWLGAPREVDTLYFGGGTPTYLSPAQLDQLCQLVLRWHPLAPGYEWTVEANPGDLDLARIEVLSRYGVNRLSLGAQSFRDVKLKQLERDHQPEDIAQSVEFGRDFGMRIAIDLIFAAPNETLVEWDADLDAALELAPDHMSTYGLTYERGTTFWSRQQRGELAALSESLQRVMYLSAIAKLSSAGFEHYEVSNFARPGERSRHNEVYWAGDSYFAAGPGAARYVDGIRSTNHRSTSTYLRRIASGESPVAERQQLDEAERARELLILGLRRLDGVDRREFARRTGQEINALAGQSIEHFVETGLLANDGHRIRLTRDGLLVSDSLWPELL